MSHHRTAVILKRPEQGGCIGVIIDAISRLPFRRTKEIFYALREMNIPRVEMKYLSMSMSSSYQVAIEEGANMVRIGAKLFGERK